MTLATDEDYEARYGTGPDNLDVLLEDASSLVRQVAHMHISLVEDDEVVVEGTGTSRVYLPNVSTQIPLVALSSVEVDGDTIDPTTYRAHRWGSLDRRHGVWSCDDDLTATYTHGLDPVPAWIVSLVCAMARRSSSWSSSSDFAKGIRSKEIDGFAVSYLGGSGLLVWLTTDESTAIESLRGPVFA